jgi:hypothetical protein
MVASAHYAHHWDPAILLGLATHLPGDALREVWLRRAVHAEERHALRHGIFRDTRDSDQRSNARCGVPAVQDPLPSQSESTCFAANARRSLISDLRAHFPAAKCEHHNHSPD